MTMGWMRITDKWWQSIDNTGGGVDMWSDLTEAYGIMMKMVMREIIY